MNLFRRCIAAGFLCLAVTILAASPASAQTSAYNAADVGPPTIAAQGGVLGASGVRAIVPASAPSSVLGLQVSRPAPAATGGQASVSGLAFTGADVVTLLLLAIPLIGLGWFLTRQARPRQAPQG